MPSSCSELVSEAPVFTLLIHPARVQNYDHHHLPDVHDRRLLHHARQDHLPPRPAIRAHVAARMQVHSYPSPSGCSNSHCAPADVIVFLTADVAALIVQAVGGAQASTAANPEDGAHIMLIGIFLQQGES
jgi:RTA1 like protein